MRLYHANILDLPDQLSAYFQQVTAIKARENRQSTARKGLVLKKSTNKQGNGTSFCKKILQESINIEIKAMTIN